MKTVAKKKSGIHEIWKRLRKNRMAVLGMIVLILMILCAIFADVIAPYGFDDQNYDKVFLAPCWEHSMGCDNLGRDVLSRIIYGSRVSLQVGFVVVLAAAAVGILLGAIAGFYEGVLDNLIMRFMDIMLSIPNMILAICIAAVLGGGMINLMIAVAISEVPKYARVTRASVLSVKEQEYIEAARAVGASDAHIIARHIIPNCIAPLIVQITLGVANAILNAAALSFIGLGIQPPNPEWGAMLSQARQYIRDYWWVGIYPGVMIMIVVYSLNLFGDGLRDALDPRLKN